ncbi:MAG: hypothetical protein JWP35_4654 [Caulobacter sp.]|nr:hypothetical protein [Caulobacter sp.]
MMGAALAYGTHLMWPVFPVAGDCRSPLTKHGVHDASSAPDAIRRLFAGKDDCNLALATGTPSGVFVLDVDCKGDDDGFADLALLQERFGPLPKTPSSKTPSGGAHLFFNQPALEIRNRVKLWFEEGGVRRKVALDVRTTGGSVALPPSKKPTGSYEWIIKPSDCAFADAPAWLLGIIDPPLPPRPPIPASSISTTERAFRYVTAALDGECQELASMGSGSGRNHRLFCAAANLGGLVGAGLLPQDMAESRLEAAARDCGLVKEDGPLAVRATISSGMKRGLANPRVVRP